MWHAFPSEDPLIGQVLKDQYRIECLLGRGSMGTVYRAVHMHLSSRVAIKVLHAASDAQMFARFRREAKILSSLRHPNIVRVMDYDQMEDGRPYLVMDLLEGEDLATRLQRTGRLGFHQALLVARAIGGGLTEAHSHGIVHRDLKPQNIFLARYRQGSTIIEVPVLVDFGISKIEHGDAEETWTQIPGAMEGCQDQLLGTPYYMSPEQASGKNDLVDYRTDQWALAAILYESLTGYKVFPGKDLFEILMQVVSPDPPVLRYLAPSVPEYARRAICRALSKPLDARFPSVEDFLSALSTPPVRRLGRARLDSRLVLVVVAIATLLWAGVSSHSVPPARAKWPPSKLSIDHESPQTLAAIDRQTRCGAVIEPDQLRVGGSVRE